MCLEGPGVAEGAIAPYVPEQFFLGEDTSRLIGERTEQGVLLRREVDLAIPDRYSPFGMAYLDFGDTGDCLSLPLPPPQNRADPGE